PRLHLATTPFSPSPSLFRSSLAGTAAGGRRPTVCAARAVRPVHGLHRNRIDRDGPRVPANLRVRIATAAVEHVRAVRVRPLRTADRKSTRLNSSHVKTSYAV